MYMMWLLSIASFLLLGGFLLLSAMRFGIPDMVSDVYYQLRGEYNRSSTGSTIRPASESSSPLSSCRCGWQFSAVMIVAAMLMMVCLLDSGEGIQCLAFAGCAGLMFVGISPNFVDRTVYPVHKSAAIISAVGCVGWCLSVCWWVTLIIGTIYLLYLMLSKSLNFAKDIWYIGNQKFEAHPWYWAETSAFADVFISYWVISIGL